MASRSVYESPNVRPRTEQDRSAKMRAYHDAAVVGLVVGPGVPLPPVGPAAVRAWRGGTVGKLPFLGTGALYPIEFSPGDILLEVGCSTVRSVFPPSV